MKQAFLYHHCMTSPDTYDKRAQIALPPSNVQQTQLGKLKNKIAYINGSKGLYIIHKGSCNVINFLFHFITFGLIEIL
jgi:hypothetical protein